ncbi:hypothetical protein HY990_00485 [Candidatus Micrarchaeota archaeon]|nr:hypothetical protein [Candidatus Micrarchaeota archaeon]
MAQKKDTPKQTGIIFLVLISLILVLTIIYIFTPGEFSFIKELIVWIIFVLLILIGIAIGLYLLKKYKKENRGRLERLFENIAAGIVGAILVTLLDRLNVYSIGLSSFSIENIITSILGIMYVGSLVIFTLGVSLLPIWAILSEIEKD